jgi:hypothetical protein
MNKEYILNDFTIEEKTGLMVFPFNKVSANMMTDDVVIKLYGIYDGEVVEGRVLTYSVMAYLKSSIRNATGKNLTLIVDLVNYGAAAQIFTGRHTDNLVNSWLTDAQRAVATADRTANNITNTTYETIDNPTSKFNTVGIILEAAITVRYKITVPTTEGVSVQIKVSDKTFVIDAADFESLGNNQYYLYFDGLHSAQLSREIYATVLKDGVAISNTLQYSVESFVAAKISDTKTDEKTLNLVKAMLRYGDAAYAFTH